MKLRTSYTIFLLIGLLGTAASPSVSGETSVLWGESGEAWTPTDRLHDFSWAGYHSCRREIPDIPVVANLAQTSAKPNDGLPDHEQLQNLINTVATPGAILIPAGVWQIEDRITIERSGIVIRGEDGAEFAFPRSLSEIDGVDPSTTQLYSNGGGFFIFSGSLQTDTISPVANATPRGSYQIPLSNTSPALSPNDFIRVEQSDPGDHSLCEYLHGGLNDLGPDSHARSSIYPRLFEWIAKVESINGATLTTDRPLPLNLDTRWSPTVKRVRIEDALTEVGIENLVFRASGAQKRPHLQEAGFNGIELNRVINGWVRNIEMIDVDNGVKLRDSHHCTLANLTIRGDKRTEANSTLSNGEIGHHPIWFVDHSSFNLITDFEISTPFHHDLTVESLSHLNVFRNGSGKRLNFDHHRNAPWANLFSNLSVEDGSRIWGSSGRWDRGPHTARDTTVWNIRSSGNPIPSVPNLDGSSRRIEAGHNRIDWPSLTVVGLNGLDTPDAERTDQWVELGSASSIEPSDLFLSQIEKRFTDQGLLPWTPDPILDREGGSKLHLQWTTPLPAQVGPQATASISSDLKSWTAIPQDRVQKLDSNSRLTLQSGQDIDLENPVFVEIATDD